MSSLTPSIFDDLPPVDLSPFNTYPNSPESDTASVDSLFDEPSIPASSRIPYQPDPTPLPIYPANRDLSTLDSDESIPGLFFDPAILISHDLETRVINECLGTWFVRPRNTHPQRQLAVDFNFQNPIPFCEGSPSENWEFNDVNQVMLFNRTDGISNDPVDQPSRPGWPNCLAALLIHISLLLKPTLDSETWDILFSPSYPNSTTEPGENELHRSRQAIINLYHPGEGISDHVDLLDRYGDGIIGVSFGTGCVMRFRRVHDHQHVDDDEYHNIPLSTSGKSDMGEPNRRESGGNMFTEIYLPPRSILIMTGEARYKWTHGIPGMTSDFVQPELGSPSAVDNTHVGSDTNLGNQLDMNSSEEQEAEGVWIERGMRLSVTFRWLLPGADVVGSK